MDVAALIPAYNPDLRLLGLVQELLHSGRLAEIIVVNDGSGAPCRPIFARLAAMPRVTVLHHAVNLGKGAAMKTGLNHFCFAMPQASGVVTADADGQHLAANVLRIAARLEETGDRLVLGSRQFALGVPLRSRFGNVLTKYAFWGVMGKKLEDTQSGLRGIPQNLARRLLRLKDSGYEFELDMLVHCRRTGVPIEACPIAAVYLDENRSSHFHPVVNSLKSTTSFSASSPRRWPRRRSIILYSFSPLRAWRTFFSRKFRAAGGGGREFRPRPAGRLSLAGRLGVVAGEVRPPRRSHGGDFVLPHPRDDARLRLGRAAGEDRLGVGGLPGQFRHSAKLHLRQRGRRARAPEDSVLPQTDCAPAPLPAEPHDEADRLGQLLSSSVACGGRGAPVYGRGARAAMRLAAPPQPVVVELGGGDSCFFDRIEAELRPSEYHVVNNNELGLERFRRRTARRRNVYCHLHDVLKLDLPPAADLVFSVGLIEHFDREGTRRAVDAHFDLLKPDGIAVISFPTPTPLYRLARAAAELAGAWIFHDERPLRLAEVAAAAQPHAEMLSHRILWPIVFTQCLAVWRKHAPVSRGAAA